MPFQSEPHINLLELLDGLPFPAAKQDVILYAERKGASEEALDQLQGISEDDYKNIDELMAQMNVIEDLPGAENLWSSADSADLYTSDEDAPLPGDQGSL
jgi:hypothetical protein